MTPDINPVELKVFLNHIYELKKGVRQMVLYTTNKRYEDFAVKRLRSQRIKFVIQPVDDERINLFFGKAECIEAIRMMVTRPLNLLTPEEDFILGACWVMTSVPSASDIAPARHEKWELEKAPILFIERLLFRHFFIQAVCFAPGGNPSFPIQCQSFRADCQ